MPVERSPRRGAPLPSPRIFLRSTRLLAAGLLGVTVAFAQNAARPGGGGAATTPALPAGGVNAGNLANVVANLPPGTIANVVNNLPAGTNIGNLINTLVPGGAGTTAADPRIVADGGVLVGDTAQATVVVPNQVSASPSGQISTAATTTTFQWSIAGGKITTDPTRPTISYVADTAGSLTLSVSVTTVGSSAVTTSAQVAVVSPDAAGTITSPPTVVTSAATATASVPPAESGDRTFRWTLTGDASIVSGQGTARLAFKPGTPGLKEVSCDVTLQRLVTITLRSFVVVTGAGPPVAVTVTNGGGGGTYPGGSRVDLLANAPAAGQVFDKWTGDTSVLGTAAVAASLSHVVITVPSAPIALTATYKAAPAWTPTVVSNFNPQTLTGANGQPATVTTTLAYFIPPGAAGLVFLLHDTGGNAASWFNSPETALLARDLVAAGYGVAALNSINRNPGAWATQTVLANNPDALNHAAALDRFALGTTKPIFFLGVANGANAAANFGELLAAPARAVKGVVLYLSSGSETLAVNSRVPEFFALAANDEALGTAGLTTARNNSQLMAGRGYLTATATNGASPVYQGRFRALGVTSATFTAADALAIWTALKTANLLDANNYLKAIPTSDALKAALPAAFQSRADDVASQLAVAYAAQEFFSDADARVINFLNNRVADTPAPPPGRMINLSTLTTVFSVGDGFALGFSITGPEKATLLIRGIGPTLTDFGVPGAIAAPRLEVNQGSTVIAANVGWDKDAASGARAATAAAAVGAFALKPGSLDTAVVLTLDPGSYTANLTGVNGATGGVLAEVYDVSKNSTRLTNLSTIAKINSDGDLLVPGLTVQGANPRTLLVRAVGPGLGDFGIPSSTLLGDPRITVLNSNGGTVATNNNWAQGGAAGQTATLTAAFPAVGAFPLKTANSDAALVTAFTPGGYTLQAGAAPLPTGLAAQAATFVAPNQTGSVLVEVYEVP